MDTPFEQRFLHLPLEQIKASINNLSDQQISEAFAAMTAQHSPQLRAAWEGLADSSKLEAAGKALGTQQTLDLINHIIETTPDDHWKLSPLCVSLSHDVFKQVLLSATPAQMQVLKKEVITEPLQHQLTVLTHEVLHHLPAETEAVDRIEQTIDTLTIKDMGYRELRDIRHNIDRAATFAHNTLEIINRILTLAWNTNRTDIIDKLSQAKEICQKYFTTIVGTPHMGDHVATGLFAKLEERMHQAFGDPNNPEDIEAAENDEPALEALVKFSVWYLRDYWDIGLLPHIDNPQIFDPKTSKESDTEQQSRREELLSHVRNNLGKIGLHTVADLKESGIFSRQTLLEYIQRNSYLLRS